MLLVDSMKILTTNYKPTYKNKILSLFKKTFQREMSEDFWNWRFEKSPYGKPIIRLAFMGERLVAFYLLQPIELLIGSIPTKALFSMTTMTDPEFAGQGIMTNLAKEVYDIAQKMEYHLVYGFANNASRHMFTKNLGFKEITSMKEVNPIVSNELNHSKTCSSLIFKDFDDSFAKFYENICKDRNDIVMINKTAKYLHWRFNEHSENKYFCYKIIEKDKFAGYFILKNYLNKKCHIVDFMLQDNVDYYNLMLNQANFFCKKNKVEKLTLWLNNTLPFYNYLLKIGVIEEPMDTFFIVKTLSDKVNSDDIRKWNKWNLTMADSDVF